MTTLLISDNELLRDTFEKTFKIKVTSSDKAISALDELDPSEVIFDADLGVEELRFVVRKIEGDLTILLPSNGSDEWKQWGERFDFQITRTGDKTPIMRLVASA